VVSLSLGFGFLPIIETMVGDDEPAPFEHLVQLTGRLAEWAQRNSHQFPLAYVQTEYFGGPGEQAAMVWAAGSVVFGPVKTSEEPLLEGAVNRAVRYLGVERGAVRDEFDALGLGRHRSNETWLSG
jgi:hypothetical protein